MTKPHGSSLPDDRSQWPASAFGAELSQALRWLTPSRLALTMQREDARWKAQGAPSLDSPSVHAAAFLTAFTALAEDLLDRLATGEFLAWGRTGEQLGSWTAIPIGHWSALGVMDWTNGVVEGAGLRFVGVRVWPAAGLDRTTAAQIAAPLKIGDAAERGSEDAGLNLGARLRTLLRSGALFAVDVGEEAMIFPAAYPVPVPLSAKSKSPTMLAPSGRRRGPEPKETLRVAEAMLQDLKSGKHTVDSLSRQQEAVAMEYKTRSRDTVVKALEIAKAKFSTAPLRQTPAKLRQTAASKK